MRLGLQAILEETANANDDDDDFGLLEQSANCSVLSAAHWHIQVQVVNINRHDDGMARMHLCQCLLPSEPAKKTHAPFGFGWLKDWPRARLLGAPWASWASLALLENPSAPRRGHLGA